MLTNPEAEAYFATLSAHSDVGAALIEALAAMGQYELGGGGVSFEAVRAVTAATVFCGACGMGETHWRLRERDRAIALASGARPSAIGPEWVCVELFRTDWPQPDLAHWALRAYDFARTGP